MQWKKRFFNAQQYIAANKQEPKIKRKTDEQKYYKQGN
jgi:hypothetical protein